MRIRDVQEGSTTQVRVLALHLTRPSNSEANVLAMMLKNLDRDVHVEVIVNSAGDDDEASRLHDIVGFPGVHVTSMDVGLPIDPTMPNSLNDKVRSRLLHRLRRGEIMRRARRANIDVVYSSQQRFDCQLAEQISRRLGVPHVVHLHYNVGPWLRQPTLKRLQTCAQVIAVSEFIAAQARELGTPPDRLTVIHNTIETSPAETSPSADPDAPVVIGQSGRMDPRKGFLDTVAVFGQVHRDRPMTRLVLLGTGEQERSIVDTIDQTGIRDVVELAGWRPNVGEWLRNLDIFVHPSRSEPFGLAVLEAMAVGLPVIAYGDGGVAEIIEEGRSGFLLDPGDLDAMYRILVDLVDNPEIRQRVGEAARERARTAFRPETAGRVFSRVLRDAAAAKTTPL